MPLTQSKKLSYLREEPYTAQAIKSCYELQEMLKHYELMSAILHSFCDMNCLIHHFKCS
jgi:hypothetical protein